MVSFGIFFGQIGTDSKSFDSLSAYFSRLTGEEIFFEVTFQEKNVIALLF